MVKLTNYPGYMGGCLWFEIPAELQSFVSGYLKSKLHEIPDVNERKLARTACSLGTVRKKEKYSADISASSTAGGVLFTFYMSFGEWRVGARPVHSSISTWRLVIAEILDEIRQYAYNVSPPGSLNTVLFQRQNAVQHPV